MIEQLLKGLASVSGTTPEQLGVLVQSLQKFFTEAPIALNNLQSQNREIIQHLEALEKGEPYVRPNGDCRGSVSDARSQPREWDSY